MSKLRLEKSIIQSAAHFVVCERCQRHGRIIFADGSSSDEACSIQVALMEMEEGLKAGLLSPDEVWELKRQIQNSGLPTNINVGDLALAVAEMVSEEPDLLSPSLSACSPRRRFDSLN